MFLKKISIITLIFLVVSCGKSRNSSCRNDPVGYTNDPALEKLASEVMAYLKEKGVDDKGNFCNIGFRFAHNKEELENNLTTAMCRTNTNTTNSSEYVYRQIFFERNHYEMSNNYARFLLMAHELGHCVFDLGHNEKDENDLMFPTLGPQYTKEQFTKKMDYFAGYLPKIPPKKFKEIKK